MTRHVKIRFNRGPSIHESRSVIPLVDTVKARILTVKGKARPLLSAPGGALAHWDVGAGGHTSKLMQSKTAFIRRVGDRP